MSARALALAAACIAAGAATAVAKDGPPGPGGGFPPLPPVCAEGEKPTREKPCLPPPCAEGQKPTREAPCIPDFGRPPGDLPFFPPGFEGEGDGPPIVCDGDGGEFGDEFPGDLPEELDLRAADEEELPGVGCVPFELDEGPAFKPGFLKRAWRFRGEANGFADDVLDVTITRIAGLPKRFRDQDDELIDEFAFVLVGARTRVIDADGDRVRGDARAAALDDANEVKAVGKLLAPDRWRDDEDDEPVPTIRAKRIVIED